MCICVYIYVCIYIYICIHTSLSLSIYIYIYMYINVYTSLSLSIYIYIYIYTYLLSILLGPRPYGQRRGKSAPETGRHSRMLRSISENSTCFFGPRPWHIEIRHRVNKNHPQLICSDLRLSD